jgi:hypothetical protein
MENNEQKWTEEAKKLLVGKKVIGVRYLTKAEAEQHGWYSRPLVIFLEGGLIVYPSSDEEGNDGGALFTNDDELSTIGTFR